MEFSQEDFDRLLLSEHTRQTAEANYVKNPLDADVRISPSLYVNIYVLGLVIIMNVHCTHILVLVLPIIYLFILKKYMLIYLLEFIPILCSMYYEPSWSGILDYWPFVVFFKLLFCCFKVLVV